MGPLITKEQLLRMKTSFGKSTQGFWKMALLRDKKEERLFSLKDPKNPGSGLVVRTQLTDPRWDVYIGPDMTGEEIAKIVPPSAANGRKQIFHMHPESPSIHEKHWNLNDGNFAVDAHELVPLLIAEIERLWGE